MIAPCARCSRELAIHGRGLCHGCYSYVRRHPHLIENYPLVIAPRSQFKVPKPRYEYVPAEPLLRAVETRGGYSEVATQAGLSGRRSNNRERERFALALRRGRRAGRFTICAADEIAIRLLGERLDDIAGY